MLAELTRNSNGNEYSQLNVMNTLTQLDLLNKIPDTWVNKTLKDNNAGRYVQRLAEIVRAQRKGSKKK